MQVTSGKATNSVPPTDVVCRVTSGAERCNVETSESLQFLSRYSQLPNPTTNQWPEANHTVIPKPVGSLQPGLTEDHVSLFF